MSNVLAALMKKLPAPQQQLLSEAHEFWLNLQKVDKAFVYSFPDLRNKVGREGQILSYHHFMTKVRDRTLELEELLNSLV